MAHVCCVTYILLFSCAAHLCCVAHLLLCSSHVQRGSHVLCGCCPDCRQAIYCLSKAVSHTPGRADADAQWDRAVLHAELGELGKAVRQLEQVHGGAWAHGACVGCMGCMG